MQYMLPSSSSGKPDLLYPKFTQDTTYTTTLGGETISSGSSVALVDPTAVAGYTTPAKLPSTGTTSSDAVLYYTDSNTISYSWAELEGTADTNRIYYQNSDGWNTVNIYPYDGTNSVKPAWPGVAMEHIENTNIWYYDMIGKDYTKCIFNNGTSQTGDLTIPTTLATQSQIYYYDSGTTGNDTSSIFFVQPQNGWNDSRACFNGDDWAGRTMTNYYGSGIKVGSTSYSNVEKYTIPSGKTTVIFNNCGSSSIKYPEKT